MKDGIKQFCDEYGVTIVAAGNDPTSGICDIADEYYDVDSTDARAITSLIRDKDIDGVYMGGNEPVIAVACQYINELGFPCYCTKKQWDAMQDKRQFKELCIQFGLPVVKKFDLGEVTDSDYPVITKPADGSGSHGFSVCRNRTELERGYVCAAEFSPTGNVIIEKFVPNDAVGVIYTISNGRLIFSTIEDKYPVHFKQFGTYVGGLFDFESPLAEEFRELFEDKIQRLIQHLKIKEGNLWIEVFHNEGNYYFNEAGFRYGGSGTCYPVDYFSGINQIATDIYYALTGDSKIEGFSPLYDSTVPRKKKYAVYPVFLRSGKILSIKGCNALLNEQNILNILTMKKEGNTIPDDGSFGRISLLVHFVYNNNKELSETLAKIHSKLKVEDTQGKNMVLQLMDVNNIQLRQKGLA